VQDAFNLGWKLAAVIRGDMGEELLDTYHEERHPVGARVLQNTRAQTALSRPDPQTGALRETVADLIALPEVNRTLGLMVTGLDIAYPLGEEPGSLGAEPGPAGADGLGLRAPDGDLPDGSRLYEWMHQGRPMLLGDAGFDLSGWADRVDVVPAKTEAAFIRPDGYVAWTARQGEAALRAALTRWCGPTR
jgi:FAD binding domain